MSKNFFEGWYFKHQNKSQTLAIIPGISSFGAFIQLIENHSSYNINFPITQFSKGNQIQIDNNTFSFNKIKLNIEKEKLNVKGEISYHNLTPLKNDIMGPFKFFPMKCRHGIISMHHDIEGQIKINGKNFDFSHGTGYIEKDSGNSFPNSYAWVQSNDFKEKCSIMVAIADVPFCGFNFTGVICAIYYKGKEYKIATYNGGKILKCEKNNIIVRNKTLRLDINIHENKGFILKSPINGKMLKTIKEVPACKATFKLTKNNKLIFYMESLNTSCEFVQG